MLDALKAAAALFVIGLTNPMLACLILGSLTFITLAGFAVWFSYRVVRAAVLFAVHMRRGIAAEREVIDHQVAA